jgi:hypothetical protein
MGKSSHFLLDSVDLHLRKMKLPIILIINRFKYKTLIKLTRKILPVPATSSTFIENFLTNSFYISTKQGQNVKKNVTYVNHVNVIRGSCGNPSINWYMTLKKFKSMT